MSLSEGVRDYWKKRRMMRHWAKSIAKKRAETEGLKDPEFRVLYFLYKQADHLHGEELLRLGKWTDEQLEKELKKK